MLSSAVAYVETRWQIARLEGREALHVGLGVAACGLVIILSLIVAYVGLVAGFTWWASRNWGSPLAAVSAVVFGHLAVAALCAIWGARAMRRHRFFHATRKEFMEDKLWLQTNQTSKN